MTTTMPSFRRDSASHATSSQAQDDINPVLQPERRHSATAMPRKWQEVNARSEEVRQYRLEEADASLPNMFQKLRRNSKQIFHSSSSSSRRVDEAPAPDLSYLRLGEGKLTFFDLPAEIRNQVYEDVAGETRVYVHCTARKGKEREREGREGKTTPNLLLVSKQVRLEYLPLLLESASISFAVRDFDFRNLMRVSSSLYSSELKALRRNPRLTVKLLATKPSKDSLASLRRWAQRRTEDQYIFPVTYSLVWPKPTQLVPTSTSVHRINTYIQRRTVLMQTLDGMAALRKEIPEALVWELQPVAQVFERELAALGGPSGTGRMEGWGEQWVMPMFSGR